MFWYLVPFSSLERFKIFYLFIYFLMIYVNKYKRVDHLSADDVSWFSLLSLLRAGVSFLASSVTPFLCGSVPRWPTSSIPMHWTVG